MVDWKISAFQKHRQVAQRFFGDVDILENLVYHLKVCFQEG